MNKKKLKVTFNAPVTLWFVILCFGAFILNYITSGWANDVFFSVYRSSLLNPLTYVRFVGYVFGHASWDHYLGNMMTLLLVAPLLEEKYGSQNMFIVMITTTIVTGILSVILFPNVALLGASGVVFALILLSSITSVKEGEIPLTFIMVAVIYLGEQIYGGIFMDNNVSEFGHILGGVCGSIIGYFLNKDKFVKTPAPVQYNDGYMPMNNNTYF
ncbi:MAG: rhomboid family intramembrane serine protease [Clostridia bacterium]|nr:rhomboid family intramembrane serine protease [Clostridia bacterium]